MPLKILHVVPYYAPAWIYGGVVRAVSGLATAQAAQGYSVSVLTTDTLTPTQRVEVLHEIREGVTVIRCRNQIGGLRRVNLSSPVGLRRALDTVQPDVIHCHELRTVENLIVSRIAASHTPLIISPHGTLPLDTGRTFVKRAWDQLFGRKLARRFNGIIALTELEAVDARHVWQIVGAALPALTVIPNGVDIPPLRSVHTLAMPPTVLFLGRLHPRKGLQFLIPAFAEANVPGSRLHIVGPDEGMLSPARALVASYGITERVTFAGMLNGAARDAAITDADVFVLPAVGEGLSMAALEAMAAGLPVILTPGCNLPEVESRGAGIIVPREITPLAEAIRALLTDPARCVSMGAIGRAWMQKDYTWSAIASRTIAFYTQLLNRSA